MSIATFSPPIKATAIHDGLSRVIVAIDREAIGGGCQILVIDGDGRFEWLDLSTLTVDLRYDPKTQIWTDPTEEGSDDG